MTTEEKLAALLALHVPEAVQQGMVYEVWNDAPTVAPETCNEFAEWFAKLVAKTKV